MKYKSLSLLFLFLTVINFVIYFYRDTFHYQPYRSYAELYKVCDINCKTLWKTDFLASSTLEQAEARKISKRWLANTPNSSLTKANLLSKYIYETFGHRYGQPKATLLQLSSLAQYRFLNQHTSDSLWCGIYSGMFSYFAWSQNIITRNIEMKYRGDSHVASECYIPELRKWVVFDPTFGMLGLQNTQGTWLDLQTFREALRRNEPIYVLRSMSGKLELMPLERDTWYLDHYYTPANSTDLYYHHTSLHKAYKPLEKLKRYLFPVSWYDIYDSGSKTNVLYRIKIFFIVLWLLSGGLLLFRVFKFLRSEPLFGQI